MIRYKVVTTDNKSFLVGFCRLKKRSGGEGILADLKAFGYAKEYEDGTTVVADSNTIGILVYESYMHALMAIDGFDIHDRHLFKVKKVRTLGPERKVKRLASWMLPSTFGNRGRRGRGLDAMSAPVGTIACPGVEVICDATRDSRGQI